MEHSIGKTISILRKEKGMTQIELAVKLGVTDKAISKWESENGIPDIMQFPALASLFGVSIDYLLTGKSPKTEIIAISKIELCAKNDDLALFVELAKENKLHIHDENAKAFIDYIFEYESIKVFNAFLDLERPQYKHNDRRKTWYNHDYPEVLYLFTISNNLARLSLTGFDDFIVHNKADSENAARQWDSPNESELVSTWMKEYYDKVYSKFLVALLTDKRVAESTQNYILSAHIGSIKDSKTNWYYFYPILLQKAYELGSPLFDEILGTIEKANAESIDNLKKHDGNKDGSLYVGGNIARWNNTYQMVTYTYHFARIPEAIFRAALHKGDFALIAKFNTVNATLNTIIMIAERKAYIAKKDTIEMAKFMLEKIDDKSREFIFIDGYIDYDRLLALDDFELYEKICKQFPSDKNRNLSLEKIIALNDPRFFSRALCYATQLEKDSALNHLVLNRAEAYEIQYLLLGAGAKLHKKWSEDDGWGYINERDEIDEIATNLLKNQIKILRSKN